MLEAVNSVLSNASYTKPVADQQSVATSYAANPEQVQRVPVQAPYVSLYIKVDVNFDKALLQLRDSDTGDVVQQIPSETQLEAYRRAQEVLTPKKEVPAETTSVAPKSDIRVPEVKVEAPKTNNTVSAATITPSVSAQTTAPEPVSVDTSA